jgi:hypothetical protein
MPRNGSGVYSHPFPDVVEGTTIESAVFNGNTSDVEQDLNTPRPIVAGGTGANNAHDAMIALSGEIAGQVVTNYDTFPFVDGDFYSLPGATAAPISDYITGICYGCAAGINAPTLEARCMTTAGTPVYVRTKVSGVWSAWKLQPGSVADLDAAYVNVTGDTMTGGLVVPDLFVKKATAGTTNITIQDGAPSSTTIISQSASLVKFDNNGLPIEFRACSNAGNAGQLLLNSNGSVSMSGNAAITGTLNVGGNVGLTGRVDIGGLATVVGDLYVGYPTPGGILRFGDGTQYLQHDATNFNLNGGALNIGVYPAAGVAPGDLQVARGANTGLIQFGGAGNKYLYYDGTSFTFTQPLVVSGRVQATNDIMVYNGGGANGTVYFGNGGGAYITYQGSAYGWSGGNISAGAYSIAGLNTIKVACIIDVFGGRGYTFGVAATTDSGIGYTDVTYSAAFSSLVTHVPVAGIAVPTTNMAVNCATPTAGAQRIHCITTTTGALVDPVYYNLHDLGN